MTAAPNFNYRGTYDENWPLPTRLTLEQYSHVFFRPDAHFVDGEIVPRCLGDSVHGRSVVCVAGAIRDADPDADLCISLRLRVSPTRIRVCDLVVLRAGAPHENVPTVPPLLCVEVLSPGQSPQDELEVLQDYVRMGVRNVWLIDSVRRAAWTFEAAGLRDANTKHLSVTDSPIYVNLTKVFDEID